jgi:hypothetical protein
MALMSFDLEGTMSIARLRKSAERCRRLAELALIHDIASELERLAQDYDEDAARLESLGPA